MRWYRWACYRIVLWAAHRIADGYTPAWRNDLGHRVEVWQDAVDGQRVWMQIWSDITTSDKSGFVAVATVMTPAQVDAVVDMMTRARSKKVAAHPHT